MLGLQEKDFTILILEHSLSVTYNKHNQMK